MKNPLKTLTLFEALLWAISSVAVVISYFINPAGNILGAIASIVGVTALIFVAKGQLIGQFFVIIFAVLYGIISFGQQYYGEMITYLGMSAPMAVASIISWAKNPFGDSGVVKINRLTLKNIVTMVVLTITVTVSFFFILKALGNASLITSTISVATSFLAAYLTFLRSPYYALGYALNDVVLIVLWIIASVGDPSCISMVVCFLAFLANDIYGFINWQRMRKKQY